MKNLLITMLISLFCLNATAQEKKTAVMTGVFDLQLGMTMDEVQALIDKGVMKKGSTIKFGEKLILESMEELTRGRRLDECEFIDIARYDTGWDLVIENIELSFFQKKLYYIEFHDPQIDLDRVLLKKYCVKQTKDKTHTETEYKPYSERTGEWDKIKSQWKWTSERIWTWKTNDKNIEAKEVTRRAAADAPSLKVLYILDKAAEKRLEKFYKAYRKQHNLPKTLTQKEIDADEEAYQRYKRNKAGITEEDEQKAAERQKDMLDAL